MRQTGSGHIPFPLIVIDASAMPDITNGLPEPTGRLFSLKDALPTALR